MYTVAVSGMGGIGKTELAIQAADTATKRGLFTRQRSFAGSSGSVVLYYFQQRQIR
jgi:hypothetical protein